jgi:hypothetical protein
MITSDSNKHISALRPAPFYRMRDPLQQHFTENICLLQREQSSVKNVLI